MRQTFRVACAIDKFVKCDSPRCGPTCHRIIGTCETPCPQRALENLSLHHGQTAIAAASRRNPAFCHARQRTCQAWQQSMKRLGHAPRQHILRFAQSTAAVIPPSLPHRCFIAPAQRIASPGAAARQQHTQRAGFGQTTNSTAIARRALRRFSGSIWMNVNDMGPHGDDRSLSVSQAQHPAPTISAW